MLHRIRKAMQNGSIMKLGGKGGGEVEADETFIGGKARNMHVSNGAPDHRDWRQRQNCRHGYSGARRSRFALPSFPTGIKASCRRKSASTSKLARLSTPTRCSPIKAGYRLCPQVVDHAVEYVNGRIHTNGLENFWSLLKRGITGTYVSVEPFHLFRYLDEQTFRYNNRKDMNEADRFLPSYQVAGKRLTYAEVTGKVGQTIN